jgi:hypothetical protein
MNGGIKMKAKAKGPKVVANPDAKKVAKKVAKKAGAKKSSKKC